MRAVTGVLTLDAEASAHHRPHMPGHRAAHAPKEAAAMLPRRHAPPRRAVQPSNVAAPDRAHRAAPPRRQQSRPTRQHAGATS